MSSFDCPSSCVAQRYLPLDRLQEAREPRGLGLIERDSGLGDTTLVPDTEADVRVSRQIARDAERLASVTGMRREELDELASLWRRTPGTEAETLLDLTCTARASRHRHLHTVT
jgi:hypothetical protein